MKKLMVSLLVLLAVAALAAPPFPASIVERAQNVTSKQYPDADTVLLDDDQSVVFQKDGTSVEIDNYYVKILTEKGRREFREQRFGYSRAYEKIQVLSLGIRKPDGTILTLDPAKLVREAADSGQMGSNIYDPDHRVVSVNFPGVAIGDIVHLEVKTVLFKPRIPNLWAGYYSLRSHQPILDYRITVDAPEELPLRSSAVLDEVKGTITADAPEKKDGRILYRWRARNVPRAFAEPNMPPMYAVTQRLLASTAADWPEISLWYYKLCEPRIAQTTPGMRNEVETLLRNAKTPLEKIQRIFRFVSQEIRYMGVTAEKEAPGYEPHDVSLTFRNRYGVCRDKAALLVAMLRLAGFDANMVLFYAGYPKDKAVPNNYFNHAVVAVALDGKTILMDPTNENTKEIFPAYLDNSSYLVASPKGSDLELSPVRPSSANKLEITGFGSVNKGTLKMNYSLVFLGFNDQIYRGAFASMPEAAREKFFAMLLRKILPGAELDEVSFRPSNLRNTEESLRIHLSFSVPDYLGNGKELVLDLPLLGQKIGALALLLGDMALEKREFPLELDSTAEVVESGEIKLRDKANFASLPGEIKINNPVFQYLLSVTRHDRTMTWHREGKLTSPRIMPEQYALLKESLRTIENAEKNRPILHNPNRIEAPDQEILLHNESISIPAPGEEIDRLEIRKKILTYAGVKANSELKIAYNPDNTSVTVSGVVISPDGRSTPIRELERTVMDQAWVAGAPRYGEGKILVVSFPNVRPGSTLEYTVETRRKKLPFHLFVRPLAHLYPVKDFTFAVEAPAALRLDSGLPPDRGENNAPGVQKLSWHRTNLAQLAREPATPSAALFRPAIRVDNLADSQWPARLRDQLGKCSKNQLEAEKLARDLCKTAANENEKIERIKNFVLREIRFAGPDLLSAGMERIFPADRTLGDRYGNAADRAILLHTMLAAVGIPTDWYLQFGAPYRATESLPLALSEAGVQGILLRTRGNHPLWLGEGTIYHPAGVLDREQALLLDLTTGKFCSAEPASELADNSNTAFQITLQEDRSARIALEITTRGSAYGYHKRAALERTPEERKRHEQTLANTISRSARVVTALAESFDTYPGRTTLTVTAKEYAAGTAQYLQVPLPDYLAFANAVTAVEKTRKNPMLRYAGRSEHFVWTITPPPDYVPAGKIPLDQKIDLAPEAGFLRCTRKADEKTGQVTVTAEIRLFPGMISQEEYRQIVRAATAFADVNLRTVLFRKK
ncbi:MAG: DUF3857 domain-containing protein [Victivallaceae bacterium]|nr:DUF3857 domain-containing protein [Victivallaceae bacterium]